MLKPGDVVGDRYEIVRLIGEGGMGSVFEARHKVLGRAVAIKVLKPEIARHEQFAQRFLVEAKAAAELHHRNIVELNDYGVDDGRPYMVMEILRGESLSVLIHREGPLSMERVVALFEPVLRALAMAHDKGVIHRDIKPENLFLVREDDGEVTPKVVDFGIAKRAEESVQLTSANMALGTPAYMAPEQIMSSRTVTGAADQYAVGVTMYESLTKRNPYNADTLNAFIVAKATQDPGPLGELRPDLDPRFVAVIMKTLARKPEDRFPSVTALREALAPFRQGSSLRPPRPPPPAPPSGRPLPCRSTPRPRRRSPRRRRRARGCGWGSRSSWSPPSQASRCWRHEARADQLHSPRRRSHKPRRRRPRRWCSRSRSSRARPPSASTARSSEPGAPRCFARTTASRTSSRSRRRATRR
jgi:serine/threonine-protein kinase